MTRDSQIRAYRTSLEERVMFGAYKLTGRRSSRFRAAGRRSDVKGAVCRNEPGCSSDTGWKGRRQSVDNGG